MNVPLWVAEIAHAFWSDVGAPEPFPRRLLEPIEEATGLSVVSVPLLTVAAVRQRLGKFGIDCNLALSDRRLRAFVIANGERGFIFVDKTDPEDEQRFSLAHELAHFLRDLLYPRRRVLEKVGSSALQVLDGASASVDERIYALLTHTPMKFQFHLMERLEGCRPLSGPIAEAEACADRLAYELLAPANLAASIASALPERPNLANMAELLVSRFGLPERQAIDYAGLLLPSPRPDDPVLKWLKTIT